VGFIAITMAVLGHFFAHWLTARALGVRAEIVFPACCGSVEMKPGRRLLVLLSGPLASYLLAVLPMTLLMFGDEKVQSLTIESVMPGYPAEQAGLRPGDEIFGIDGERARDFEQLREAMAANPSSVKLDIHRPGEILQVELVPKTLHDLKPVLGLTPKMEVRHVGFGTAFVAAHQMPLKAARIAFQGTGMQTVGGPVVLYTVGAAEQGGALGAMAMVLAMGLAIWSMLFALVNLLPLPGLDGGLLVLTVIQLLAGGSGPKAAFHARARKVLMWVGLALVVLLTGLVLTADFHRLLG
jgi:regulator of sigma E protease